MARTDCAAGAESVTEDEIAVAVSTLLRQIRAGMMSEERILQTMERRCGGDRRSQDSARLDTLKMERTRLQVEVGHRYQVEAHYRGLVEHLIALEVEMREGGEVMRVWADKIAALLKREG